jgi:hypothetical protein
MCSTLALLCSRKGITDPSSSWVGELIPDEEEHAIAQAAKERGGRITARGGYLKLGEQASLGEVLALAESVWGPPAGTADGYDLGPTLLTERPLADALAAAGFTVEPESEPANSHGGARPGAGRPVIGKPTPVRLGESLTLRVDAARRAGESRAEAIRRLLDERLVGGGMTLSLPPGTPRPRYKTIRREP